MKYTNIVGQKFGCLLIIEESKKIENTAYLKCLCDCGKEKLISKYDVLRGKTQSCGCSRKTANIKHGCTKNKNKSPEYRVWRGMKSRCYSTKNTHYKNYGGRGIRVCNRWLNSFENFLADMGTKPTPQHSIDRYPNNDGNYEPSNCRWATIVEQSNNKSTNVKVTFMGQVKTIAEWAEVLGFDYITLWGRYKKTGVKDFDKPLHFRNKKSPN